MLLVNEITYEFRDGLRVVDVAAKAKPGADLFIVNGHPVSSSFILEDGDSCWLIRKGEQPTADELERLLYARHSPGVHDKVKKASVGIMGLGGLGSPVAVALARVGVGHLLLADFDVVEPSNLNRQQYFIDQIGEKKTQALKYNLGRINPYLRIETVNVVLTEESIPALFNGVDVLAECFDGAEMKAAALRCALGPLKGKCFVGASGMAGFADSNMICTRKIRDRVYLVGDGETEARPGQGLMAPRVGIAAHHQANQILRLLLEVA
ncbi:MAG: sulfur carrier protein ThiS adenylyltransferase ThiF [Desulfobulbaceae bacterium]|nr:sulfur carrier protein ThiS adenylyltransferase ThiF [Desulfobulbaceae bacterium]